MFDTYHHKNNKLQNFGYNIIETDFSRKDRVLNIYKSDLKKKLVVISREYSCI